MAIPTITSVSPNPMFVGGQRVTVVGTNFRTPYPPDLTVRGPLPPPLPSVALTFNGVDATQIAVKSATELTCLAPDGEAGSATIILKNLNAAGVPIAGELVTFVGASYARADLSVEDDFERFTRAVIQMLKRQVIANVVTTESVDYTDDAGKLNFNLTKPAGPLPVLSIVGPFPKRNKFYGDLAQIEQRGNQFVERRYMRTADLVYKITMFDDKETRLLRLIALITKVCENNTYFRFQNDPGDITKGFNYYELDATDFGVTGSPNNSDLRMASGQLTFSSFTFEDVAGFPGSAVDLEGAQADDVVINFLNP